MKIFLCDTEKLTETEINCGYSMLDSLKKARVDRCNNEANKRMLIASDLLVRNMIGKFLKVAPLSIVFAHSSHGKPVLPNGEAHFNVSHSGKYWVGCIDNSTCGIDIEAIRDVNLESAKRFCNENELRYIKAADNPTLAFLYIWTRKEAYFKSIGCGIATVLSAVDVLKERKLTTHQEDDYILSVYADDNKLEIINLSE